MERLLRRAADECDLVLSSGSTSASAVDVIYRVIEERGDLLLHGVAVKPGKPMLIGRLDRGGSEAVGESDADGDTDPRTGESAYVGLPGYPVCAHDLPDVRRARDPRGGWSARTRDGNYRRPDGRRRALRRGTHAADAGRTARSERRRSAPRLPGRQGSGATTSLVEADGVVAVDPDTEYLDRDERVTVQLFSPDVRPPTLLGVGEDDPALNRLLDRLDAPRYLPVGSREGLRRLRDGVPDVAVVAGPTDRDVDAVDLGGWAREWGLVVPEGNPAGVTGLADLVDGEMRFVNRPTDSGLRRSSRRRARRPRDRSRRVARVTSPTGSTATS